MGMNNVIFLENIEWFDETGQQLVHRIPEEGSGEIKYGAQLTVRESQAGIFFYKGKELFFGKREVGVNMTTNNLFYFSFWLNFLHSWY